MGAYIDNSINRTDGKEIYSDSTESMKQEITSIVEGLYNEILLSIFYNFINKVIKKLVQ